MTEYGRRVFEMLVRVSVFRSTHQDLIAKDSPADLLFQKIEAAQKTIAAQSTLQVSGKNAVRLSTGDRTSARDDLRRDLEAIARTAASMGLKQFFMPRGKSDRSVADVARVFVEAAEPLKNEFIANHMPEDFLERLRAEIEGIEQSIKQQAASKGARKTATASIVRAQAEALAALNRLDPMMDNLLRDNAPVRATWDVARHVERAAISKKVREDTVVPASSAPSSVPSPSAPLATSVAAKTA